MTRFKVVPTNVACDCGRVFGSLGGRSNHRRFCAVHKAVAAWQAAEFADAIDRVSARAREIRDSTPNQQ